MTTISKPNDSPLGRQNLLIFEQVMGATRVKHKIGFWAHEYRGHHWPVELDDQRAKDAAEWERGYAGPDFSWNLNWLHRAEAALAARGKLDEYVLALVNRISPAWEAIEKDGDVLAFWFSLLHATAAIRAGVMARVIGVAGTPGST